MTQISMDPDGLLELAGWELNYSGSGYERWIQHDRNLTLYDDGSLLDSSDRPWATVKEFLTANVSKRFPPEDKINKPNHYHFKVNGVELDCFAVMEALGMDNYHLCTAFSYLFRCLHKGDTEVDVAKAVVHLNRWLGRKDEA